MYISIDSYHHRLHLPHAAPSGKVTDSPFTMANYVDQCFDKVDKDHDGTISKQELSSALKKEPLKAEIEGLFASADKPLHYCFQALDGDGDGKITKKEFRDLLAASACEAIFTRADTDKDGTLSKKELAKALKSDPAMKAVFLKAGKPLYFCFEALDADGDGKITKAEFLALLGAPVSAATPPPSVPSQQTTAAASQRPLASSDPAQPPARPGRR